MNNNFNIKKLGVSLFVIALLLYFMMKTPSLNSKIIFIPFIICAIAMVGKNVTLPFWIVGIFVAKRRFFAKQSKKDGRMQIPTGIIVGSILVFVTLIAGIWILAQGVMNADGKLLFAGGFFAFGAFTFVLAALTVRGCFEHYKVDVLGLYIGILFVVIGIGVIAMIYNQNFGLWIVLPVMMIGAGVLQIIKCIKNKKNKE